MPPDTDAVAGPPRDVRSRIGVPAIAVLTLMLGTCSNMPGTWEQVRMTGRLVVATRNSPMAYYQGAAGPEGPEYELATGFARRLGVRLEFRFAPSATAAVYDVLRNRAQVAAAGLVPNAEPRSPARFGPAYQHIDQYVVYRVQDALPQGPTDLVGRRIVVARGSAHAASLWRLAKEHSGLRYTAIPGADYLDLLAMVNAGKADLTVADSTEFTLGRHFYPDLRPAFKLAESEAVAWAVAPRSVDLLAEVERYFAELEAIGTLEAIRERYRRSLLRYDRVDAAHFVGGVRERLPLYRAHFEEAAAATGFDWRLLAAIGYQESRWDAGAVSPTGVRGLMMLTAETAQRVGVGDRTDPRESILGAARYLEMIRKTVPRRIAEPDRTWLALAAYNVGYGHLEDARILTQNRGGNPDAWVDVRENLPLLAQERWYTRTRRGYARGWEPVGFVRNVQTYTELLRWMTTPADATTAVADAAAGSPAAAPRARRPP